MLNHCTDYICWQCLCYPPVTLSLRKKSLIYCAWNVFHIRQVWFDRRKYRMPVLNKSTKSKGWSTRVEGHYLNISCSIIWWIYADSENNFTGEQEIDWLRNEDVFSFVSHILFASQRSLDVTDFVVRIYFSLYLQQCRITDTHKHWHYVPWTLNDL